MNITTEQWMFIANIVTMLSLIDFALRILRWVRSLIRKKSGFSQTLIEKYVRKNIKLKNVLIIFRMLFPLIISVSLLLFDIYSTSPINKIFVIRVSFNVAIIISNILFVIIVKQIDKAKEESINQSILMSQVFS